jgi:hypothetical protein
MNTDVFNVKLGNKSIVFVRTDSGRFFDITRCHPITDSNSVLPRARQVAAQDVADLVAAAAAASSTRRKASKIRRRRRGKEVYPTQ